MNNKYFNRVFSLYKINSILINLVNFLCTNFNMMLTNVLFDIIYCI